MADVASDIKDWSTTASSNSPTDSTSIGAGLADNFQQIQATVAIALRHKGADIASASTTELAGTVGLYHDITGTTTITSFGSTAATGQWKLLQFDGALSITYNATSMILPGNASITTAAGDMAMVIHEGSGNWRMLWYTDDSTSPILLDEDTMSSDSAVHAASQQSIKAYVDTTVSTTVADYLPLAGGTLTGALTVNGQIVFPATQNAAAGVNTLDDYEEGSWTPGIAFSGGSTGVSYFSQAGVYTKIGNIVHVYGTFTLLSKGSSSGVAQITGLPFTSKTAVGGFGTVAWAGMTSSLVYCNASVTGNSTVAVVNGATAAATTLSGLTEAAFSNTSNLNFSITYTAAN